MKLGKEPKLPLFGVPPTHNTVSYEVGASRGAQASLHSWLVLLRCTEALGGGLGQAGQGNNSWSYCCGTLLTPVALGIPQTPLF